MDKTKLNFVIDALMFLCLTAMAGLGLLMKYVLVPGRVARATYGRPVELTWWGWDRHDWGEVHFYLALVLAGLLTLHLILHWHLIPGLFARLIPDPKLRSRVAWAFLLAALILLYFPFLISPRVQERGRGWQHRTDRGGADAASANWANLGPEGRGAPKWRSTAAELPIRMTHECSGK